MTHREMNTQPDIEWTSLELLTLLVKLGMTDNDAQEVLSEQCSPDVGESLPCQKVSLTQGT